MKMDKFDKELLISVSIEIFKPLIRRVLMGKSKGEEIKQVLKEVGILLPNELVKHPFKTGESAIGL